MSSEAPPLPERPFIIYDPSYEALHPVRRRRADGAVPGGEGRGGLSLAGAALLTLLFVGSTGFTESISAAKYPSYAEYRRRASPIIPWPPKQAREEVQDA